MGPSARSSPSPLSAGGAETDNGSRGRPLAEGGTNGPRRGVTAWCQRESCGSTWGSSSRWWRPAWDCRRPRRSLLAARACWRVRSEREDVEEPVALPTPAEVAGLLAVAPEAGCPGGLPWAALVRAGAPHELSAGDVAALLAVAPDAGGPGALPWAALARASPPRSAARSPKRFDPGGAGGFSCRCA